MKQIDPNMKKNVKFTLSVNLFNIFQYSNESDEHFEKRITEEGKKKLRYYLSGYLLDPNKKVFEERIEINEQIENNE